VRPRLPRSEPNPQYPLTDIARSSHCAVFAGLVCAQGILVPSAPNRAVVTVAAQGQTAILPELEVGDSIAVDGVCLTVEALRAGGFAAAVSPETMERSVLAQRRQTGDPVNLEPALRVGDKLGGHFVTGHVDGVGYLAEATATERAWELVFCAPPGSSQPWQQQVARYLVPKGSVAVNGISLTVAECDRDGRWFKAAVVPLTYEGTNLSRLTIGSWVNLESDLLGKYADKLLGYPQAAAPGSSDITPAFLAEHGYG